MFWKIITTPDDSISMKKQIESDRENSDHLGNVKGFVVCMFISIGNMAKLFNSMYKTHQKDEHSQQTLIKIILVLRISHPNQ